MSYTCKECKNDGTAICACCSNYMGVPDRWEAKPITHADRIRAMSDEELAGYLTDVWYGLEETPGMCDVCYKDSVQKCSECWLDWLKQEATP